MHRMTVVVGTLCVLAPLVAVDSCLAAVVRGVHADASSSATRIIVDVDGEFRYHSHASEDGKSVFVDIEGATPGEKVTLGEGAPRLVPVSDRRVDGVLILTDASSKVVRVSVDIAGRVAPRLDAVIDASRLVLTFADGSSAPATLPIVTGDVSTRDRVVRDRSGTGAAAAMPPIASARSDREGPAANAKAAAISSRFERTAPVRRNSVTKPGDARRRSILERPVVVIDPGHGGKDPGARAWTGELEKDIVLDLADRVARRLRKSGDVEVVMTRSGDEFIPLADRRDASRRWDADVFVSIHANASHNAAARGIETYFHTRSAGSTHTRSAGSTHPRSAGSAGDASQRGIRRLARAENGGREMRDRATPSAGVARASLPSTTMPVFDHRAESARLATLVQTELVRQLGMRYEAVRDLGAKEGPFFVIGDNAAPSVLVEAAFLTHREEGLRMRSEVYREQIADGVSRGILAFVDQQRRAGAL